MSAAAQPLMPYDILPYVTFVFKYRSRGQYDIAQKLVSEAERSCGLQIAMLQAAGIINNSAPPHLFGEGIPKEEVRDGIRARHAGGLRDTSLVGAFTLRQKYGD